MPEGSRDGRDRGKGRDQFGRDTYAALLAIK
jgi:hypothetical protein